MVVLVGLIQDGCGHVGVSGIILRWEAHVGVGGLNPK